MAAAPFLIAATVISAASSAVAGIAAARQAQFRRDAAQVQADFATRVAEQNATFALALGERNAQSAINVAAANERRLRSDRNRRIASAQAAFGAQGTQLAGSPLAILADLTAEAEVDALTIRFGGEQEAISERLNAAVTARRERLFGVGQQFGASLIASRTGAAVTGALIAGAGRAGSTLLGGFDELGQRDVPGEP